MKFNRTRLSADWFLMNPPKFLRPIVVTKTFGLAGPEGPHSNCDDLPLDTEAPYLPSRTPTPPRRVRALLRRTGSLSGRPHTSWAGSPRMCAHHSWEASFSSAPSSGRPCLAANVQQTLAVTPQCSLSSSSAPNQNSLADFLVDSLEAHGRRWQCDGGTEAQRVGGVCSKQTNLPGTRCAIFITRPGNFDRQLNPQSIPLRSSERSRRPVHVRPARTSSSNSPARLSRSSQPAHSAGPQ
jgi:hypothetical protein